MAGVLSDSERAEMSELRELTQLLVLGFMGNLRSAADEIIDDAGNVNEALLLDTLSQQAELNARISEDYAARAEAQSLPFLRANAIAQAQYYRDLSVYLKDNSILSEIRLQHFVDTINTNLDTSLGFFAKNAIGKRVLPVLDGALTVADLLAAYKTGDWGKVAAISAGFIAGVAFAEIATMIAGGLVLSPVGAIAAIVVVAAGAALVDQAVQESTEKFFDGIFGTPEDETFEERVSRILAGLSDSSSFPDIGFNLSYGTMEGDVIEGSESLRDSISALAGNDIVHSGHGGDYISGGEGDDSLYGEGGEDTLLGGVGADALDGGINSDQLEGGDGFDTYRFSTADFGGSEEDIIVDTDGLGKITFNGLGISGTGIGFDNIRHASLDAWETSDGSFRLAVIGTDTKSLLIIHKESGSRIVVKNWTNGALGIVLPDLGQPGGPGNPFSQTNGNDLAGRDGDTDPQTPPSGDDYILGLAGNDGIDGGYGDDWIEGGSEDDLLYGGAGNDDIDGGAGDDVIFDGSQAMNWLRFDEPGNDQTAFWLDQLNRPDVLKIGNGWWTEVADGFANGADATERLFSLQIGARGPYGEAIFVDLDPDLHPSGNDIIDAGDGSDTVHAGAGDDVVDGGIGNDLLLGSEDHDTVSGGDGDDLILGDVLTGAPTSLSTLANPASATAKVDGNDILSGGSGNDHIYGQGGNDAIEGGVGDDVLAGDRAEYGLQYSFESLGAEGRDYIDGGAGNDQLYGDGGSDTLLGGDGIDRIYADAFNTPASEHGDDDVKGGAGSDDVLGMGGNDLIRGGDDDDTLAGDAHVSQLALENHGSDSIYGEGGNDTLFGNGGNDYLDGGTENDQLVGNEGGDHLAGGEGDDKLWGESGNDTLRGDFGADELQGGDGSDFIDGGDGNDKMWGDADDDTLRGGAGIDQIVGATGDDTIDGGAGDDTLTGDNGNDTVSGDSGVDKIYGNAGDDHLLGGADRDYLYGGDANDSLQGGDGNDQLNGESGNDILNGGVGSDTVDGGAGNDTLDGGADYDTLKGGAGADTYNFGAGRGYDTIIEVDQGNEIVLETGISDQDVKLLRYSDSLIIRLEGMDSELKVSGYFGTEADASSCDIRFADGTVWSSNDVRQLLLQGTDGADHILGYVDSDDVIHGGEGNDSINGDSGNDYLYGDQGHDDLQGGEGNDVLVGGVGDDALYGGNGDDKYVFNAGDGAEYIGSSYSSNGGYDVLQLGAGLDPSDFDFYFSQGTVGSFYLEIKSKNSGDSIEIADFAYIDYSGGFNAIGEVDEIKFANGQTWSFSDIVDVATLAPPRPYGYLVFGTSGDDALVGSYLSENIHAREGDDVVDGGSGYDRLWGGAGNDQLSGGVGGDEILGANGDDLLHGGISNDQLWGGNGSDTFLFNRGDGSDSVSDGNAGLAEDGNPRTGIDVVLFGPDISSEDVVVTRDDTTFTLAVLGTPGDQVVIRGQTEYGTDNPTEIAIEEVHFADGTIWSFQDLITLSGQSAGAPASLGLKQISTGGDALRSGLAPFSAIPSTGGNTTPIRLPNVGSPPPVLRLGEGVPNGGLGFRLKPSIGHEGAPTPDGHVVATRTNIECSLPGTEFVPLIISRKSYAPSMSAGSDPGAPAYEPHADVATGADLNASLLSRHLNGVRPDMPLWHNSREPAEWRGTWRFGAGLYMGDREFFGEVRGQLPAMSAGLRPVQDHPLPDMATGGALPGVQADQCGGERPSPRTGGAMAPQLQHSTIPSMEDWDPGSIDWVEAPSELQSLISAMAGFSPDAGGIDVFYMESELMRPQVVVASPV